MKLFWAKVFVLLFLLVKQKGRTDGKIMNHQYGLSFVWRDTQYESLLGLQANFQCLCIEGRASPSYFSLT